MGEVQMGALESLISLNWIGNVLKIDPRQFLEAQQAIKGKAFYTPMIPLHAIKTDAGHRLYLKAENLQPSGSFKIRGATYCISRLPKGTTHVVAYSTGNHAQAVALAAQQLGIKATIVMSPEALEFKVKATLAYGAEVIIVPTEKRQKYTEELAASSGAYLIPPFDHPDIITGQGTIGLEILEQLTPGAVFVPVGGGGLIAGIAMAIKQKMPSVLVIGVEPELEDDAFRSFKSGTCVSVAAPSASVADAVKIPRLGNLTFPLVQHYVDDVITVTEKQIIETTVRIVDATHMVIEPSGVLGVAGALSYSEKLPLDKPIVCIASGGNITVPMLYELNRKCI